MTNRHQNSPPYGQNGTKRRYESLDGLRAYSAVGIVMMHVLANIGEKPSSNYLTSTLIPFFSDFTLLFMMVSGFSLCCGYYEKIKNGLITPNLFYKKRYLRILPFFALLCVIDLLIEPSKDTLAQVYANLTLCFNLLPEYNITVIGVGWFLGVVFVFYMLFPFFVFMLDNKRRAWLSFVLSLILLFLAFEYFGAPNRQNIIFDAPYFLIGGLLYLYRDKLAKLSGRYKWCCIVSVVAVTILFFATRRMVSPKIAGFLLELGMFTVWFTYAIGSCECVLNNRLVRYLSGISMEIYLCHMLFFRVVEKIHLEKLIDDVNALYVVTYIFTLGGAILFSHLVKYYALQPLMRRIN